MGVAVGEAFSVDEAGAKDGEQGGQMGAHGPAWRQVTVADGAERTTDITHVGGVEDSSAQIAGRDGIHGVVPYGSKEGSSRSRRTARPGCPRARERRSR